MNRLVFITALAAITIVAFRSYSLEPAAHRGPRLEVLSTAPDLLLQLEDETGEIWLIEASEDCRAWSVLGTVHASDASGKLEDQFGSGSGWKFFRAVRIGQQAVGLQGRMLRRRVLVARVNPLSPNSLVVSASALACPEGNSAHFEVKLAQKPESILNVTVTKREGSASVSVKEGASLVFTQANWNQPQIVKISADDDLDRKDTAATLSVASSGLTAREVAVICADPDHVRMGPAPSHGEWFGPFPSWADAKRDFGAVGDGLADDTDALQRALDSLRPASGRPALYLPNGTYRISRTLRMTRTAHAEFKDLMIIGEDPAQTALIWDGPNEGTMLDFGAWYSKLARLTFDGRGRAGIGLAHGGNFSTYNEFTDLVFKDLSLGIEAGLMSGQGNAETVVRRCHFLRCAKAGISVQNWNSLDWFVWHCFFEDCELGVSNIYGAGNYHVFESIFKNSRTADMSIGNTSYFSIRNNFSTGSKKFFTALSNGASALVTLQGNVIVDVRDVAVEIGNRGPVVLLDNIFKARIPLAVRVNPLSGFVSIGNTFSEGMTVQAKADGLVEANEFSKYDTIVIAPPTVPAAPARSSALVFEVPADGTGMDIQRAIQQAASAAGSPTIIHVPQGTFRVDQPLELPAGKEIHLVGEGGKTALKARAGFSGPLLRLAGPSRAQVRDLRLYGDRSADGVWIEGSDQSGARVWGDQVMVRARQTGVLVDRAVQAVIDLHNYYQSDCGVGMRVLGQPNSSIPGAGRVAIFAGGGGNNELSYEVAEGGRLLVRDTWYETPLERCSRFIACTTSGMLTLHGANIAPLLARTEVPSVEVKNFRGQVSLVGALFTFPGNQLAVEGDGRETEVLVLGGTSATLPKFAATSARMAMLQSLKSEPSGGAAQTTDQGAFDSAFLARMLRQTRTASPEAPSPAPVDRSDARLHRVIIEAASNGVIIR